MHSSGKYALIDCLTINILPQESHMCKYASELLFQDIGYAKLAGLDPKYGLCKSVSIFFDTHILSLDYCTLG